MGKFIRIGLVCVAALGVSMPAAQAAKYWEKITAGPATSLDLVFTALGCAGAYRSVTLVCYHTKGMTTTSTYTFKHGTSGQGWTAWPMDGTCNNDKVSAPRTSGNTSDSWTVTCVSGAVTVKHD